MSPDSEAKISLVRFALRLCKDSSGGRGAAVVIVDPVSSFYANKWLRRLKGQQEAAEVVKSCLPETKAVGTARGSLLLFAYAITGVFNIGEPLCGLTITSVIVNS